MDSKNLVKEPKKVCDKIIQSERSHIDFTYQIPWGAGRPLTSGVLAVSLFTIPKLVMTNECKRIDSQFAFHVHSSFQRSETAVILSLQKYCTF